ncbi:MAG: DUF2085 domain-containing protein [Anaerolineaceae bacterium]|nr:DUF2085 domain-containing protein [Anaerolineaceae bacterium]
MLTVTLYTRSNCPPCQQALDDLRALQSTNPHNLVEVNLDRNPVLLDQIGAQTPVMEVGPYRLLSPFSRQDLQVALGAARDRVDHFVAVGDKRYVERLKRGHTLTGADRATKWLSNHYVLLFNLILLVYIGVPFLAPVFMKIGWTSPANVIYRVYRPLCHQLAFRSWFLFGEQPAYPRALAGVKGLTPFEAATGIDSLDIHKAADFVGNSTLGYKVAFCERDVAIYGSLLLFGLIYGATGRRLRAFPWYLWVLVGLLPIALDGFSQLPSLLDVRWHWLAWFPIRESTPLLRTITGFLFGFTTAWFGYPFAEESMRETRMIMARKVAVASQPTDQLMT